MPLCRPRSAAINGAVFGIVTVSVGAAYVVSQLSGLSDASAGEMVFTILFLAAFGGVFGWIGVAVLRGSYHALFGRNEILFEGKGIKLLLGTNEFELKAKDVRIWSLGEWILRVSYRIGDRSREVRLRLPRGQEAALEAEIVELTGVEIRRRDA